MQQQIPFDGGEGHTERLLRTISYLVDRGQLVLACDLLEFVSALDLSADQRQRLRHAALRLAERAETGQHSHPRRPPLPPCRVLPFPSVSSATRRARAATAASFTTS